MYFRFVSSEQHPTVDAELGMFRARDQIDFSLCKASVQKAHEEVFSWFNGRNPTGGLTYPRLIGKARTRKIRKSLFWFEEDATFFREPKGSMLHRARELAEVMSKAGVEIREIKVTNPGEIIWRDTGQILAYPGKIQIPRAF